MKTKTSKADTKKRKRETSSRSLERLVRPRYWICIIGPVHDNKLPHGADSPPRRAAIKAVMDMAGTNVFECWSGWCERDEFERVQKAKYAAA